MILLLVHARLGIDRRMDQRGYVKLTEIGRRLSKMLDMAVTQEDVEAVVDTSFRWDDLRGARVARYKIKVVGGIGFIRSQR